MLAPSEIARFGQTGSHTSQLTQACVIVSAIGALCRVRAANAVYSCKRRTTRARATSNRNIVMHADGCVMLPRRSRLRREQQARCDADIRRSDLPVFSFSRW